MQGRAMRHAMCALLSHYSKARGKAKPFQAGRGQLPRGSPRGARV